MADKQINELARAECLDLLSSHHFGRLGFLDQVGTMPMILPVNYVLDADTVVFRTDAGSKLNAALHQAPVAFEIDGIDRQQQVGWSVLVRGHVAEVSDEAELEQLQHSGLVAWAPGPRGHFLRISPRSLTGRRISVEDLPATWLG